MTAQAILAKEDPFAAERRAWGPDEFELGPPPSGSAQRKFNPHQPRNPHTGEWIDVPDLDDLLDLDEVDDFDNAGRFTDAYRERYGDVIDEYNIGRGNPYSIAITDKKSLHIADDTGGTHSRVVLQELTPKQARDLSTDIEEVLAGSAGFVNQDGIGVYPAAGGVRIVWPDGRTTVFGADDDHVDELDEGLVLMADAYDRAFGTRRRATDLTPGHDELHHYWTKGEGLAKWASSPHPWTTLYHHLVKYVGPERAKRMASSWHHEVFGIWVGEKRGDNPVGPG